MKVLNMWYTFLSKVYILGRTTQLVVLGMDLAGARQQAMTEDQDSCGQQWMLEQALLDEFKQQRNFIREQFSHKKLAKNEVESLERLIVSLNGLHKVFKSEEVNKSILKTVRTIEDVLAREPK